MKLFVFSDSHGHAGPALAAAARHKDIAACFFLGDGDGQTDADHFAGEFPSIPLYQVRGNCDFASLAPTEGLVPCAGRLVFYTHGHVYNVKNGPARLQEAAAARGADIALFGHTHTAHLEQRGGVWLFNPGAVYQSRRGGPTCGLVTIENNDVTFELIELKGAAPR